jgi:hypothetical protein
MGWRIVSSGGIAVLAALLCACGGASRNGGAATASVSASEANKEAAELRPAPLDARVDADRDNDVGAPDDDRNNPETFGRAVSLSERRAIAALVKRYYAAALAENGARGCALLYSTLAESVPVDDSREPGAPAYQRGQTTCAGVLTALFKHYHAQLAAELPSMQVTGVHIREHEGFAHLRFGGGLPERRIGVKRERRTWKMTQLYDQELP